MPPMPSFTRPPRFRSVSRAADRDTRGAPASARPWVLAATILGSSIAFIDGSVVGVALPVMQAELGTTVRGAQWIVNGYLLMLGALILVGGAAGDRLGRRRVFVAGLTLFALASVGCGLAPNVGTLIAMRALQGVGGAMLVPSSLAIISAAFPEEERGRAIGTWAGFSALTTAFGPVLGGWLVDAWSWRAIFFINVPLALVAVAISRVRGPESRAAGAGPVDWPGGLLAIGGPPGPGYGLAVGGRVVVAGARLHQRAARAGRGGHRPRPRAGEPRGGRGPRRLARRAARDRRARRPRLRADGRVRARLYGPGGVGAARGRRA